MATIGVDVRGTGIFPPNQTPTNSACRLSHSVVNDAGAGRSIGNLGYRQPGTDGLLVLNSTRARRIWDDLRRFKILPYSVTNKQRYWRPSVHLHGVEALTSVNGRAHGLAILLFFPWPSMASSIESKLGLIA